MSGTHVGSGAASARPDRRRVLLGASAGALAAAGAIALGSAALSGRATARANALWVWHEVAPDRLVALATDHQVGRLLVWVAPSFTTDPGTVAWLGELARAARAHGVTLDALGGDPQWAVQPDLAAHWASEAAGSGWFARLHLDVEPHALPQWSSASDRLLDGLLAALRAAAGAGLPVDADVPYWLGTVRATDGRDGLTAVCSVVSSITVMAYQDGLAAIRRVSAAAIDAAGRAGIPVQVGVNLSKPVADAAASSLWGADRRAIAGVLAGAAELPGTEGIAIHDADALLALSAASEASPAR